MQKKIHKLLLINIQVLKLQLIVGFLFVNSYFYGQDSTKIYETKYKKLQKEWDLNLFKTDTLSNIIKLLNIYAVKSKNDSLLIDVYSKYVHFYLHNQPNSFLVVQYNTKASFLSNKLNVKYHKKPYEFLAIGNIYLNLGLYEQAIINYKQEFNVKESEMKDYLRFSIVYNNLGICYRELNIIDSAINNFYFSVQIRQKINPVLVAHSYTYLAGIMYKNKFVEKTQNYIDTVNMYLKKFDRQQYTKNEFSIDYYNTVKSDVLLKTHKQKAHLFLFKKNFDSALIYFDYAYQLADSIKNKMQIADILYKKADTYFQKGDFKNAQIFFNKAIPVYEDLKNYNDLAKIYLSAIKLFNTLNNKPNIYKYQTKYIAIQDSVTQNELTENTFKEQLRYEINHSHEKIENIKHQLIHENSISEFRFKLIIVFLLLSVLLIGLIVIIIRYYKNIKSINKELDLKNSSLTATQTKLEIANKEIDKERQKLFVILENIPAFICLQDMEFSLNYVNQKFIKIFGDPQGKTCFRFLRNRTNKCDNCPTYANCEGLVTHGCEWNDNEGNTYVLFDNSFVDIEGRQMILKIGMDITDRKKAELQLAESRIKLLELNATKDKLFSIIAHDLKNPFNAILGFSQLLQTNKYPEKTPVFTSSIANSAQSAYKLLENLLTWARSQTGNIQFEPKKINLQTTIRECSELLRNQYELKYISLIFDIAADLYIWADSNMISTVLRNLISNAIKYTNINGIIEITVVQNAGDTEIRVRDTGVGIKQEILEKLFKIEHKISSPGTNNEPGTGLGLILCKEFIEKHNGKIWAESVINKGSVFKFTLPVKTDLQ